MIIKLQKISMKFEKNFFLAVTKRSLSMMIPFIMAACVASAIMNIPISGYKELISTGSFSWIYALLDNINKEPGKTYGWVRGFIPFYLNSLKDNIFGIHTDGSVDWVKGVPLPVRKKIVDLINIFGESK